MLDDLNDADAEDGELKLSLLILDARSLSGLWSVYYLFFSSLTYQLRETTKGKRVCLDPQLQSVMVQQTWWARSLQWGHAMEAAHVSVNQEAAGRARSRTVLWSPEACLSGFCPAVRHHIPKAP